MTPAAAARDVAGGPHEAGPVDGRRTSQYNRSWGTWGTWRLTALVAVATVIVEGALAMAAVGGWLRGPIALLAHVLVLWLLVLWTRRCVFAGDGAGPAALLVLSTAIVGPLGGLGVLAVMLMVRGRRLSSRLLAEWYDRIAFSTKTNPVSRLAETIAIGRTVNLAAPLPSSFMDVIERGSLSERQTVLGLIARRFNVDYLPALHLALRSPEPIIRVQAAAVAAHIRGDLNAKVLSELARCLDAAVQPGDALRVAGRIDLAIASGLVEEAERPRIERDKTRIVASALAAIDARRAGGPDGVGLQGLDEEGLEAYDCHLLEQQRFAATTTSGWRIQTENGRSMGICDKEVAAKVRG